MLTQALTEPRAYASPTGLPERARPWLAARPVRRAASPPTRPKFEIRPIVRTLARCPAARRLRTKATLPGLAVSTDATWQAEIDQPSQELGMRRMSDTPHLSDILQPHQFPSSPVRCPAGIHRCRGTRPLPAILPLGAAGTCSSSWPKDPMGVWLATC